VFLPESCRRNIDACSVLCLRRSLCYSLSPNTQFIEKLLRSNVAKMFSQTELQELTISTDTFTSSPPLHTSFAFPAPGLFFSIEQFYCMTKHFYNV